MRPNRCQVCSNKPSEWTWQPDIDRDNARGTFTTPGSHYRGFMTVKVCDECKQHIQAGGDVTFTRRGTEWWLQGNRLVNSSMCPFH